MFFCSVLHKQSFDNCCFLCKSSKTTTDIKSFSLLSQMFSFPISDCSVVENIFSHSGLFCHLCTQLNKQNLHYHLYFQQFSFVCQDYGYSANHSVTLRSPHQRDADARPCTLHISITQCCVMLQHNTHNAPLSTWFHDTELFSATLRFARTKPSALCFQPNVSESVHCALCDATSRCDVGP